jgi:hypothetical protein
MPSSTVQLAINDMRDGLLSIYVRRAAASKPEMVQAAAQFGYTMHESVNDVVKITRNAEQTKESP